MPGRPERSVRPKGRELALGVLCHLESYPELERADAIALVLQEPPLGDREGEDAFARLAENDAVRRFAAEILESVEGDRQRVDATIREASRRWRLERMDRVDRNVLRLAVGELMHAPDTPRGVILSEAVRLAKRYGSEHSVSFVNGVLESIAQSVRPASPGPREGDDV